MKMKKHSCSFLIINMALSRFLLLPLSVMMMVMIMMMFMWM